MQLACDKPSDGAQIVGNECVLTKYVIKRHQLRTIVAFEIPVVQPVEALPFVGIVAMMPRDR